MRPRSLEPQELVRILLEEHRMVKELLVRIHRLLAEGRERELAQAINEFKPYLDQHIIDEEATILKILLEAYGREEAESAIKVFQQHREIHQLITELTRAERPEDREEKRERLKKMLEDHFAAEESRIFPWALETYRKRSGNMGRARTG